MSSKPSGDIMDSNNVNIVRSSNTLWHQAAITREHHEKLNGHKSRALWFTGLPQSGKSTVAHAVQERLYSMGCSTTVLDGDNVRHGLCSDLGFSHEDRTENIRRITEMVKLFVNNGIIAMTAFISPYKEDRERSRNIIGENDFIEIYIDCSIDICEKRDTKGHYKKARAGEIQEFTGVSSPYDVPENPHLRIETGKLTLEDCVNTVIQYLLDNNVIKTPKQNTLLCSGN